MKKRFSLLFALVAVCATSAFAQPPGTAFINNNLSCDVVVTLYCGDINGCDQTCSTTVCVPANTPNYPVMPCGPCKWEVAFACPADGSCPTTTVCSPTADVDCVTVAWSGCNNLPTTDNGNLPSQCPSACGSTISATAYFGLGSYPRLDVDP